jgi:uncharacterized membrane protein
VSFEEFYTSFFYIFIAFYFSFYALFSFYFGSKTLFRNASKIKVMLLESLKTK